MAQHPGRCCLFTIPIGTDSPLRSTPWMNGLLIAANLAVFIAQRFDPELINQWQLQRTSLELPCFLTYAFFHVGWLHLLLNMLVLCMLGNNINDRLGPGGYLAFYLAGAVFSGVGFLLAGGQAMVGASGAVGAVMGAYLVLLPRSNITLFVGFGSFEVRSMYFVIVYFLYNVAMSLGEGALQDVAYAAHIAGMLFGFGAALGLCASRLLPRQPPDLLDLLPRRVRDSAKR